MAIKTNPSNIHLNDNDSMMDWGVWHMNDRPELYEPSRSNHFELQIDDLKDLKSLRNEDFPEPASNVIRLSVISADVPHFSQDNIPVKRGNMEIKYAGSPSYKSGTVVVNDFIGADTKGVLMAWQNQSFDIETQKVGLAQDYKKTARLVEYTPDYQVIRTWILVGC